MNELGQLLKELRGKRSLRSVARDTGLSHTHIADIERGYRRETKTPLTPSPDTLKRLAKAYHYSYEVLMALAGHMDEKDDEANDLETILRSQTLTWGDEVLSDDEKERAIEVLKVLLTKKKDA